MASLWKDPRSRFWVACFTDKDGRRVKRSTKETVAKKAQTIADNFEKIARTKQTVRSVRATISSLSQELWGVSVTSPSLRDHVSAWLEEKRSSTAESTMEFYEKSTEKFVTFLGNAADEPIDHIERATVAKFKIELSKNLSAKTINHHLKLLKMVFKAARRDGMIVDDPTEFVETVKKSAGSVRRPFSMEELKKVLAVCDEEWRSMVCCGLYTGQRLSDVITLLWANVDLVKGEIRLVAKKTQRQMMIPIARALLAELKARKKNAGATSAVHPKAAEIFARLKKVGTLSNQFSAILVKAGLRDTSALSKEGQGKGRSAKRQMNELSFHSLRHTAVTFLKEAGVPQAVAMELVGHDSEQISGHYTHVGLEALRKAADSLPDIFRDGST